MPHSFLQKLKQGEKYEQFLDTVFSPYFEVRPVARSLQRIGVDRVFVARQSPETFWRVEYKTDLEAAHTGNVFIETVSVDGSQGKLLVPGWGYTSQADTLIYYLPHLQWACIIPFSKLRVWLKEWEIRYPIGKAANQNYKTHGLKIPIRTFARCADKIADCKHIVFEQN